VLGFQVEATFPPVRTVRAMSELRHECGVAAIYYFSPERGSQLVQPQEAGVVSRLLPRILLDVQNRGQLAAGMSTYNPKRSQLLSTYKKLGTVAEVFQLNDRESFDRLMADYAGPAAIGHVRYATCGQESVSYSQPFEHVHVKRHKWFSFAFNGQLANYRELEERILAEPDSYLARHTDTEIVLLLISRALSGPHQRPLLDVACEVSSQFDGAYSLVYLDAMGQMMVLRDPLGIKPLCYAVDGGLFAAASESVALLNLGFSPEQIRSLEPGNLVLISNGTLQIERYAASNRRAHCFFEWIYFSNVASTLDGRSVYLARKALGEELAKLETVPLDWDTIVVPVPDTSKAAADGMAYKLGLPCLEGLIRNRFTGRTFIDEKGRRMLKVQLKYTPLREVLEGKRVLLVEDSIVRSTTMRALLRRIYQVGRPKEVHVRVASPPIVAPCFYGIDMSTISELFAPRFIRGGELTEEIAAEMAKDLGCDSLRYLPVKAIARAIGLPADSLCEACITGCYPTAWGQKLYEIAQDRARLGVAGRTYEALPVES